MKISKLLANHHVIIKRAWLANMAQAYFTLRGCAERVQSARLCGLVNLRQPNAEEGRLWATLTALEGKQSIIEEHFSEEELMEFADALAFVRGLTDLNITFRLETMAVTFLAPLEVELKQAGVVFDLVSKNHYASGLGSQCHASGHGRGGAASQR
jgi:hypothetical protein